MSGSEVWGSVYSAERKCLRTVLIWRLSESGEVETDMWRHAAGWEARKPRLCEFSFFWQSVWRIPSRHVQSTSSLCPDPFLSLLGACQGGKYKCLHVSWPLDWPCLFAGGINCTCPQEVDLGIFGFSQGKWYLRLCRIPYVSVWILGLSGHEGNEEWEAFLYTVRVLPQRSPA